MPIKEGKKMLRELLKELDGKQYNTSSPLYNTNIDGEIDLDMKTRLVL